MYRPALPALAAFVTCAAIALAATPARAQYRDGPGGFYVGAGIADANFTVTDGADCGAFGYCDRWSRDGHSDSGWTATAGWRVNRWFALEAGYVDAGTPRWDDFFVLVPSLNGIYDVQSAVDIRATELSAVGILPFFDRWDVYAKLGGARWDAKTRQRAVDPFTGRSLVRTFDDSGTGFVVGLGAGVTFAERVRARVEVRGIQVDRDLLVEPSGSAVLVVADLQIQYRF
jgi:OOP family OmpA-OmpF porin